MKKLYAFEKLHRFLDERNYPKISSDGFQVIKTDFNKAFQEGKISFEADGIYLEYQGKKWRGYIYMKDYKIQELGGLYPKFHLKECKTILEFKKNGLFKQYYIWSNDKVNDIIDRKTKELHKDIELKLCSNCSEIIFNDDTEITTLEFYESLDKESVFKEENVRVDLYGYVMHWQKISNEYKRKQNYTCENCGIQVEKKDKHFVHTHHKNGDKLNNSESNLQCLCISCHSKIDENHRNKIKNSDLEIFREKYQAYF